MQAIWIAATRAQTRRAFDTFLATYEPKHPKATECPGKDRQALLAFYDFPAEYRVHLEVITGVVFQDGVAVPKKVRQEIAT